MRPQPKKTSPTTKAFLYPKASAKLAMNTKKSPQCPWCMARPLFERRRVVMKSERFNANLVR